MKNIAAALLVTSLVSSCGGPIIRSTHVPPGTAEISGVPYFLPTTVFVVDLEIKLTKDAAAKCEAESKVCISKISATCKIQCAKSIDATGCEAKCKAAESEKCSDSLNTCKSEAGDKEYAAILSLRPTIVPNPERMFSLTHERRNLAHDDLKLKTTEAGLLASITATADDRTGPILESLIETAVNYFKFQAQLVSPAADLMEAIKGKYQFVAPFGKLIEESGVSSLEFPAIPGSDDLAKVALVVERLGGASAATPNLSEVGGIYAATPVPYKITADFLLGGSRYSRVEMFRVLPDKGAVVSLPVERTPFSKVQHTVELKNGMLVAVDIDRPSPAEGFVKIPLEISKKILSLPGEIIKFRYDGPVQDLEGQSNLLKARADLIAAEAALEKARTGTMDAERTE